MLLELLIVLISLLLSLLDNLPPVIQELELKETCGADLPEVVSRIWFLEPRVDDPNHRMWLFPLLYCEEIGGDLRGDGPPL